MKRCLEIIFQGQTLAASSLWTIVSRHMGEVSRVHFFGQDVALKDLSKQFVRKGNHAFTIEFGCERIEFSTLASWGHQVLRIISEDWSRCAPEDLIRSLSGHFASFLQASFYDWNYYYWKNATDLLEFRDSNIDVSKLKLKENGLPRPLDGLIVDTSQNPSRRVLREGYVEMIGSPMWISQALFDLQGRRFDASGLVGFGFDVSDCDGVTRIAFTGGMFISDATEDVQRVLRKTLYGNA